MISKDDFNRGLSKAAREALQETMDKSRGNNPFYKKPKRKKPKTGPTNYNPRQY